MQKVKEPEISVGIKGLQMTLSTDSGTCKLMGLDPDQYPPFPVIENILTPESVSLAEPLRRSLSYVMNGDSKMFVLTGVNFRSNGKTLKLLSADGVQAGMSTLPMMIGECDVIIPSNSAQALLQFLELPVHLAVQKNSIYVANKQFDFMSQLLDGKFPDVQAIIPQKTQSTAVFDSGQLKEALEKALIFSVSEFVKVEITGDSAFIVVESQEQGAESYIEALERTGPEVTFGINGRKLLSHLEKGEIILGVNSPKSPITLQYSGDDTHIGIVMPMSLSR